uniref:Uncharacterized protein n=1 Tax=Anopheles christyi TaxID=43041 RepID=A0A182KIA6_9DIPT
MMSVSFVRHSIPRDAPDLVVTVVACMNIPFPNKSLFSIVFEIKYMF